MKTLLAFAASLLLLAACGQTGPLRLPEPETPPVAAPAAAQASELQQPPPTP